MNYKIIFKTFLLFNILTIYSFQVKAQQNWDTLPWKSYSDFKLQNLNKTYMSTNILYDRVFPLASVDEFTGLPATTNLDTTHPGHLTQAYYEIYNSSYNNTGKISPDFLDSLIKRKGNSKEHPIGIFYYKFNSLDSNALQDHLIDTLPNGQFVDVPNRSRNPYFINTSFLATPLLAEGQIIEKGNHTFYIDPIFFLRNDSLKITYIKINFGDGQGDWIVNNPFNTQTSGQARPFNFSIIKNISGPISGRIIIAGIDILGRLITLGNPFKVFVKNSKDYQALTPCKGGGQQWIIEAPQSRLDAINSQYGNPIVDYVNKEGNPVKDTAYFYFAGNGSTCNNTILKKPIIFIDGFDPDNSRSVYKIYEDYINVNTVRNSQQVKFGDYMLSEGYDFIILDFKNGNDLLERNAMTVVSLIERLNQQYGSTMQQGITLIGPSMGSLIAQYALAYMEKNNIPHNVKTYISFDGCHQGANVPIGLQNYVEYFTKKGIFGNKKTIREGLYNGLGARQMLAHHVSANSQIPAPDAYRTIFLQNLTAVNEYPQLCRKVAVINGTNTGILNPAQTAGSTLLRIYTQRKGWKSIWGNCNNKICMKLDWNCYNAQSNGIGKILDNYTVDPLFNVMFSAPIGNFNKYVQSTWSNSSQDNAPGGTFGNLFGTEPGNLDESNFVFLLKEAMYLLTGSRRTGFYQNINQFTMMPSYSSADLRFSSKNLYLKWDDKYLCGNTPFDYVYAPPVNEQHVLVSAKGSQYFENEIRCASNDLPIFIDKKINGVDVFCTNTIYSISTCKSASANVIWTALPSGYININGSGSSVNVSKINEGTVTLTATLSGVCYPSNFSISKTITIGKPKFAGWYNSTTNPTHPLAQWTRNDPASNEACYGTYIITSTNITPNSTVIWQDGGNSGGVTWYQIGNNLKFYFSGIEQWAYFTVLVTNVCGTTSFRYRFHSTGINCSGPLLRVIASPNPSTSSVNIELINTNLDNINSEIKQIKVIDKAGVIKRIIEFGIGNKKLNLDISNLPSDVYTILVSDGNEWYNTKIIKN